MPGVTLSLLRSLESDCVTEAFEGQVKLAKLNKLLLGFLRRVEYAGPLRAIEEERYSRFLGEVSGVMEALEGLDYALFKFRRP